MCKCNCHESKLTSKLVRLNKHLHVNKDLLNQAVYIFYNTEFDMSTIKLENNTIIHVDDITPEEIIDKLKGYYV